MATGSRRSAVVDNFPHNSDSGRELFEACRGGDLSKVKTLVNSINVNSRDTAGRKSTPLHFAAGESVTKTTTTTSSKQQPQQHHRLLLVLNESDLVMIKELMLTVQNL